MGADNITLDRIRVGPAGWSYKDWAGQVYPKPQPRDFDPLTYLAHYFDAIEINSSFYRIQTPKTTQSWVDRVEGFPDFRFTAKLWQGFTHEGQARAKDEAGRLGAEVRYSSSASSPSSDSEDSRSALGPSSPGGSVPAGSSGRGGC